MSNLKEPICDICKTKKTGLRLCNNCNTVFCNPCSIGFMNTGGAIMEVFPHCPKCKSKNIIDKN